MNGYRLRRDGHRLDYDRQSARRVIKVSNDEWALEARTQNLRIKVGCPAAPCVLLAQKLHMGARKAHIAQSHGRASSHEPFHEREAQEPSDRYRT
jgi:hypothetical protein